MSAFLDWFSILLHTQNLEQIFVKVLSGILSSGVTKKSSIDILTVKDIFA